jgi:hypothetical protein
MNERDHTWPTYLLSAVDIATDLTIGVLERVAIVRGVVGRWMA